MQIIDAALTAAKQNGTVSAISLCRRSFGLKLRLSGIPSQWENVAGTQRGSAIQNELNLGTSELV